MTITVIHHDIIDADNLPAERYDIHADDVSVFDLTTADAIATLIDLRACGSAPSARGLLRIARHQGTVTA